MEILSQREAGGLDELQVCVEAPKVVHLHDEPDEETFSFCGQAIERSAVGIISEDSGWH
jgi:hypothetical protein